MIKKGEFYYMWEYNPKAEQKIILNKIRIINRQGEGFLNVRQIKVFYPQWPFKEGEKLLTETRMLKTEKQINQMSFRNKRLTIINTF